MKAKILMVGLVFVLMLSITTAHSQTITRLDAIWARMVVEENIVLDGKLDEAAWAQAESIRVQYPTSSEIIPGSGWHNEGGALATDPTDVTQVPG